MTQYKTTIAILQYLSERTVRASVTHIPLLDHSPVINHLRYRYQYSYYMPLDMRSLSLSDKRCT